MTGLEVKDFELLVSLNVFNGSLMNDAIFKFKRYEDSSLSYTGVNKHEGEDVGGWDTVIKRDEYETLFYNQQYTLTSGGFGEGGYIIDSTGNNNEIAAESKYKPEALVDGNKNKITKNNLVTSAYGIKHPSELQSKKMDAPKIDTSNISKGSVLRHKSFGIGEIIEIKNGMMTVRFGKAEKRFQFPQSIENGFFEISKI